MTWRAPRAHAWLVALACAFASSCATSTVPDIGLEGLSLTALAPTTIVPQSTFRLEGRSFVDAPWGESRLRLRGVFRPDDDPGLDLEVDITLPATFLDFDAMEAVADTDFYFAMGNRDGTFTGQALVEVKSVVNNRIHDTQPLPIELLIREELVPRLDTVQTGGLIFVNDRIEVIGDGLLLGGAEGITMAVVEGTYLRNGEGTPRGVGAIEVPVVPSSPFDRTRGHFAFAPTIAGIKPGQFEGEIFLRNRHASEALRESGAQTTSYEMIKSTVFSVSPDQASLGQFVVITGGGFVGAVQGATTELRLDGTFTPTGAQQGLPVVMDVAPEFVDGTLVNYVLSDDDNLGQAVDYRRDTGRFIGQISPIISFEGETEIGDAAPFAFSIVPVKQLVYLDFTTEYVESLRAFGLRAADSLIRDRITATLRRDFSGVNLEVRLEPPHDFSQYTYAQIAGADVGNLGVFGHDTAPGKDVGNARLDDAIGGSSSQLQENGSPGYGGVFIESLFGFSTKPGALAQSLPIANPLFDLIFDPFRPDQDGSPVIAADLAAGVPTLVDATGCPATERSQQIACAVWVLGSLIANELSHEIGHSLGLAEPQGEAVHNAGDQPDRLMDEGVFRPFLERAELGTGPARFCEDEYLYLREILRSTAAADPSPRPPC